MQVYKFYEVLNDLYSYFLLADIKVLESYKVNNQLPNDLATEFTTNVTGDDVVYKGIMIPLAGIENYPYTVIFNFTQSIELLQSNNEVQISQKSYCLQVESGQINLFTWRALQSFDENCINQLAFNMVIGKPSMKLENGWYQVDIYAGQSWQRIEENTDITFEPTIEFVLKIMPDKPNCTADIFTSYRIHSDDY